MLSEPQSTGAETVRIQIREGVPNTVGAARLFVFGSTADSVELGIVLNGEEIAPEEFRPGDVLNLGGSSYLLAEMVQQPAEAPRSVPGASAGRVVAVLTPITTEP
jgi:hypothetical protein